MLTLLWKQQQRGIQILSITRGHGEIRLENTILDSQPVTAVGVIWSNCW